MRAVSVEDLKPGMVLARTLVNDDMIVILSEGTLLTKAHITRLSFLNIPVVYVKDEYELSQNYQAVTAIFNRGNKFVQDYDSVIGTTEKIFDDVKKNGKLPVLETKQFVSEKVGPMAKESGVIDYLFALNHLAADVYQHSLRVSILTGVIAKWMQKDSETTKDLILAGLLHDIGKTRFEQRLLDKNIEHLEGKDYEDYIKHTVDGSDILSHMPGISEGVKLAAMQHHERMDGSGFPFGTHGTEIHEYARIIAVADIYDNITTEREGYVKRTPFSAIDYFTEHLYTTLDPAVVVPVLTHIKDAFLGSVVVLSNGQKGRIAAFPNDFAARPIVDTGNDAVDLNDHPDLKILEYNPK